MRVITLRNSHLQAEVLPGIGGSLARLDWISNGKRCATLRPCLIPPISPSQVACFAMLPWANRISPGGFDIEGRRVNVPTNREGEPCPIHGEGWQHAWDIVFQSTTELRLTLNRSGYEPFTYIAELHYSLVNSTLRVGLQVRNVGAYAMPFGVGLHPWFERSGEVRLQAPAGVVFRRGAFGLPAEQMPLPEGWNFASMRTLPTDAVDHVFGDWTGKANIELPNQGIHIDITTDMGYFVLYAPNGADFFCFEPIDHMINAHDQVLAPGQQLCRTMLFKVAELNTATAVPID